MRINGAFKAWLSEFEELNADGVLLTREACDDIRDMLLDSERGDGIEARKTLALSGHASVRVQHRTFLRMLWRDAVSGTAFLREMARFYPDAVTPPVHEAAASEAEARLGVCFSAMPRIGLFTLTLPDGTSRTFRRRSTALYALSMLHETVTFSIRGLN